jgi:hypothetical protein
VAVEARQSADGNSTPRRRSSFGRAASLVFVLVGVGLVAAACGGGSASPGVANLGSTTTSTQAPSSKAAGNGANTTARYRAALAYVSCMRSHGVVNFPDPTSNGTLNVNFQTGGKDGSPVSSGINRNSSQYTSADKACRNLLPGGVPTPAQNQQALVKGLKFAQCMRSHGVPDFPDPTTGGVVHLGGGVDPSSPQFQSATKVCQSLVPGTGAK